MLLTEAYIPHIPVTEINPWLSLARLDLLPYPAGGNKWFKLKYNLLDAQAQGARTLITFGGAYSNHLHATAEAAQHFGFDSIGIVRGESKENLNGTLRYCLEKGMRLLYLSREDYRKKSDPNFLYPWMAKQGIAGYLIPEGGTNVLAVKGAYELAQLLNGYDILASACGTGGTLAGLVAGASTEQEVWGIPVLKGGVFLYKEIASLLNGFTPSAAGKKWNLHTAYHFGGYAKMPEQLLDFIRSFYKNHQVLLDPVYTGKLLFALFDLKDKGFIPDGKKVLALHTGGLQGWNGLPEKKQRIVLFD